jgi:hypothetical protein
MSGFSPAAVIVHPSGTNNVGYEQAFPLWVTGSTAAFPAVQPVTGTIRADITGTVNVNVLTQPNVTGSVNVTNSVFPVTGTVLAVPTGTQTVAGTVTAVITGTIQTSVTNFPAVQTITGTVSLSPQPITVQGTVTSVITGTVQTAVQSLPNITGSVNVTNSIFPITGTVLAVPTGTQTVAGTVTAVITGTVQTSVTSLPNITGSVNVTNSLFNVTGSVGVNNTVRVTGSLAVDNVVRVTSTGSLPVTAQISVSGTLVTNANPLPVTQAGSAYASFTVMALNTAIGNNKSMLSIYNPVGSGVKLKLREFYIRNPRQAAVTGIAADFRIYRFSSVSAPTGGSTVTPVTHDTDDSLAGGVTCQTGATVSGEEANALDRMVMSTDEWGPGTLDVEANQQAIANYLPARAKRDPQLKALTANPGQGLHLKHVVNSTAGEMDIIFVFTQETS